MPQIFPRFTNAVARVGLLAALLLLATLAWGSLVYTRSPSGTGAHIGVVQRIPFSHQHHAGALGIECRYCHTSVEYLGFAGIPPTKTCMNCHSQIWVSSDTLAPVRDSYRNNRSLSWRRVYNLPGFVYFDHSIHVQKGIGCSSCHGRVDQMPFVYQVPSLLMEWCLACHRNPARHIRPREEVFNMQYQPGDSQSQLGVRLVREYGVRDPIHLSSCSICHR